MVGTHFVSLIEMCGCHVIKSQTISLANWFYVKLTKSTLFKYVFLLLYVIFV